MSSGDGSVDNRLASLFDLDWILKAHPWIEQRMKLKPAFNFDYDIPYIAGISTDLQTCYFHRRFVTTVIVECKPFYLPDTMWNHELMEAVLVFFVGMGYDRAHEFANLAEWLSLKCDQKLYDAYNAAIDKQVPTIEKLPITRVPMNLALYPYLSDAKLVAQMRAAMVL